MKWSLGIKNLASQSKMVAQTSWPFVLSISWTKNKFRTWGFNFIRLDCFLIKLPADSEYFFFVFSLQFDLIADLIFGIDQWMLCWLKIQAITDSLVYLISIYYSISYFLNFGSMLRTLWSIPNIIRWIILFKLIIVYLCEER